jgi:uncharacterized protein YqeY
MPPQNSEETGRPEATEAGATEAGATGDIRARMRRGLVGAMKARDQQAVEALRSALARIDNAEAVDPESIDDEALDEGVFDDEDFYDRASDVAPTPPSAGGGHPAVAGSIPGVGAAERDRRVLTPEQMAGIVRNEVIEREAAADILERVGRPDQAGRLRSQANLLTTYLPPPPPPPPPSPAGPAPAGPASA